MQNKQYFSDLEIASRSEYPDIVKYLEDYLIEDNAMQN